MSFQDGQTVGIDLGTSYSAIARLDSTGNPEVLPNTRGKPITPSVVILGKAQKVIVGDLHHPAVGSAEHIVTAVKRNMGNSQYSLMHEGRKLNADFLSGMILRRLALDAEKQIGKVANAVITVPYYFNDLCRRATSNAGRIAGLNVIDLLNEPTAATLTYAWLEGDLGQQEGATKEKTILVYDLGGGTFDVTVVRYSPTEFHVMATDGDTLLGGLDWTYRLVNFIADKFVAKFGKDPRKETISYLSLFNECDAAKVELSQRERTFVRTSMGRDSTTLEIHRSDFEKITADLLQRTKDTTEFVLEQCRISPAQLDEIVLVGGSTYMPSVRNMLHNLSGKPPCVSLSPQLGVAQGAAIHAAILEAREKGTDSHLGQAVLKRLQRVRTQDVNSHSLGVEISDLNDPNQSWNHIMIPRNQPLPFSARQRFVTNRANPDGITIRLLEGEATDVDACTYIGEIRIIGLPPNLPVGSPVEVTYTYDADRKICVSARELTGSRNASVQLEHEGTFDLQTMQVFQSLAEQYQTN